MAQTGFTPLLIYSSSTATNAPTAGNLLNNATGSELAINIADGKLFYKDSANAVQVIAWKIVPATAGGTGQTSYAIGDLLYANTTTTLAKLADVATGNALISGGIGVAPSYGKIGLTTHVSGTLPVANGGTGLTTLTAGYIPYGNGTSAFNSSSTLTYDGSTLKAPNLQGPCFSAYLNGTQSVTSGVFTKLQANTKEFDTSTAYDATTNYRFTPLIAGYYQFNGQIEASQAGTQSRLFIAFYKNGSVFKNGNDLTFTSVAGYSRTSSSALIYLNGSTDYVEFYGLCSGTTPSFNGNANDCYFQGVLIRSA